MKERKSRCTHVERGRGRSISDNRGKLYWTVSSLLPLSSLFFLSDSLKTKQNRTDVYEYEYHFNSKSSFKRNHSFNHSLIHRLIPFLDSIDSLYIRCSSLFNTFDHPAPTPTSSFMHGSIILVSLSPHLSLDFDFDFSTSSDGRPPF